LTFNPADARPLYHQLAGLLRDQIHRGELRPGDQIPTESELADQYQASRNTVRLALGLLRNEGLLISRRGLGSFVRDAPPLKYYASLTGSRTKRLEADRRRDTFAQQVEAQGKTPKQVSTVEVLTADDEMRTRLALDLDAQLGVRRRVMYADDEPVQLGDSYYPLDIVQGSPIMDEADVVQGTDQVLEDLGHIPTRYEDEITWRMPTAAEAQALHIVPGIPVGRLARTSFDQNDRPIEVYVVILPGDRHVLLYDVDAE